MKKALLIGINYKNTNNKLNGCINDVKEISNILKNQYNYNEIKLLIDEENSGLLPTKKNILDALNKLIYESIDCVEIYFHYSGHGSYILDKNNDEIDNKDECICATDGYIIDDELFEIFRQLKCDAKIVMDCCHSGTALDLKYTMKYNVLTDDYNYEENSKYIDIETTIYMISSCKDNQTSAEIYNENDNIYMGALTYSLLEVLKLSSYNNSISLILKQVSNRLSESGCKQVPILSSNKQIDNLNTDFIVKQIKAPIYKIKNTCCNVS